MPDSPFPAGHPVYPAVARAIEAMRARQRSADRTPALSPGAIPTDPQIAGDRVSDEQARAYSAAPGGETGGQEGENEHTITIRS